MKDALGGRLKVGEAGCVALDERVPCEEEAVKIHVEDGRWQVGLKIASVSRLLENRRDPGRAGHTMRFAEMFRSRRFFSCEMAAGRLVRLLLPSDASRCEGQSSSGAGLRRREEDERRVNMTILLTSNSWLGRKGMLFFARSRSTVTLLRTTSGSAGLLGRPPQSAAMDVMDFTSPARPSPFRRGFDEGGAPGSSLGA